MFEFVGSAALAVDCPLAMTVVWIPRTTADGRPKATWVTALGLLIVALLAQSLCVVALLLFTQSMAGSFGARSLHP